MFPTNRTPLVVAIIIIRGHFLVFHLHLLHQSLQIGILLSLCNARLPLTPFPLAYRDLHDQVSFILLNDALQLRNRFRKQFNSVLILHRRRRHHIQRRSDQRDLHHTHPTSLPSPAFRSFPRLPQRPTINSSSISHHGGANSVDSVDAETCHLDVRSDLLRLRGHAGVDQRDQLGDNGGINAQIVENLGIAAMMMWMQGRRTTRKGGTRCTQTGISRSEAK